MSNICPVCKYDKLIEPPYDIDGNGSYEICPMCGFQFGLDDFPDKDACINSWRAKWIKNGSTKFSKIK